MMQVRHNSYFSAARGTENVKRCCLNLVCFVGGSRVLRTPSLDYRRAGRILGCAQEQEGDQAAHGGRMKIANSENTVMSR